MVLFRANDSCVNDPDPSALLIDRWLDRVAARHLWACLLLLGVTLALALPGLTGLFPMDRDEPRFAQASKQMLETGDFVDIRFHDEARNKKPVGIYWLQAGAVALGQAAGVLQARTSIWLYRLPSLLGAICAVLLTYWMALPLASRRAAILAGALMASTVLLVVEAHLAKTDAVLLATLAAAMGVLARAWMRRAEGERFGLGLCFGFWTAIAVGILIKGPITPMIVLFAAVALSLTARSGRWLLALRPWLGLAWCLLIVLPWFVLIVKASGGAFFAEAIGHDMAGKVAGAQESHGAPPGTYLLAFWVTAWPMAPFVLLGGPVIWRERWSDPVLFLLAWVVPAWLLFEAVPTKLPHYVLPLYPALAVLAARALDGLGNQPVRGMRAGLFGFALLLLPLCLPVALALAPGRLASSVSVPTLVYAAVAFLVASAAAILAVRAVRRAASGTAVASSVVAAIAIYGFVLGWFMNADRADLIALSPRLATAGRAALGPDCTSPDFATVGDREPSLVFLTGTGLLMTDAPGAAAFMTAGPCRIAFVDRPYEAAFASSLGSDGRVRLASRVTGLNINGGKMLDIGIYVRQDDAP